MATPKREVFFFYDGITGAPKAGLTPTFVIYKDDAGADIAQPTIYELGGGAYYFTPTVSVDQGLSYIVASGGGAIPKYYSRYIRYEDWYADNADVLTSGVSAIVDDLQQTLNGKWVIYTTGPHANHLVHYAANGSTILHEFALYNINGVPATTNVFSRIPI